jgi:hypothetical protein
LHDDRIRWSLLKGLPFGGYYHETFSCQVLAYGFVHRMQTRPVSAEGLSQDSFQDDLDYCWG